MKIDDLKPNTGKVVEEDGKKIAVYKSESGEVYKMSAICPHKKCTLEWNGQKSIWNCPCHGSQFDGRGRVLKGPAVSNLLGVE